MRGGRYAALSGQHRQERLDFYGCHVARMPQIVEPHEPAHPIHICLFSAEAIVQITGALAHLVKQTLGLKGRAAAGKRWIYTVFTSSMLPTPRNGKRGAEEDDDQ